MLLCKFILLHRVDNLNKDNCDLCREKINFWKKKCTLWFRFIGNGAIQTFYSSYALSLI